MPAYLRDKNTIIFQHVCIVMTACEQLPYLTSQSFGYTFTTQGMHLFRSLLQIWMPFIQHLKWNEYRDLRIKQDFNTAIKFMGKPDYIIMSSDLGFHSLNPIDWSAQHYSLSELLSHATLCPPPVPSYVPPCPPFWLYNLKVAHQLVNQSIRSDVQPNLICIYLCSLPWPITLQYCKSLICIKSGPPPSVAMPPPPKE